MGEGAVQHLEAWHDAYVMLGTTSGALIGLLFIATSLHIEEIAKNALAQRRARTNTYHLLFTLAEATLVLIPLPSSVLGSVIAFLNLAMITVPARNAYLFLYRNPDLGRQGGWAVWRMSVFIAAYLLGAAGGVLTAMSYASGLYLVTAGYVLLIVVIASVAWSILLGIGEMETKGKAGRRSPRKASA